MNSIANAPYSSFERGPELLLTPSWQILRQQILHLAQFGGGVQVICGPEGAGKSTFLAFLQKAADSDNFYSWQVPAHCDNATLFRQMLEALGLRPGAQAGAGELIYSLRNYAQSLERSRQRLVFAFDDAHHLGNPELAALISVLQGSSESGFGLHFILLALPGLAERIDELHLVDVSVQDMQLPPFSPAELNTVFSNTFLAAGEPLTLHGEALERVWVQSEGLPGRALDMARALKTRPSDQSPTPPSSSGFRFAGLPIWHMAAVGLLIVLWALFFHDGDETPEDGGATAIEGASGNQRRSVPIEIIENPRPGHAAAARTDATAASERTPGGDAAVEAALSEPLDNAATGTEASTASELATSEPAVSTGPAPTVPAPEPNSGPELNSSPELTPGAPPDNAVVAGSDPAATAVAEPDAGIPIAEPVEESPAPASKPATAAAAAAPPAASADVKEFVEQGEKALLSLAPSGYVLQLMATTAENSLGEYVARQPNRQNLLVHSADRDGRRMYLLVEGFYADKDAALSAIDNLPAEQQAGRPWPKKVSVIHQEIRQVRRN